MKKFILALTSMFVMAVSANAMSYEQARQQALFLTDKMAYDYDHLSYRGAQELSKRLDSLIRAWDK